MATERVDTDSLPRAYGPLHGSGVMRAAAADFRVEELLGFTPSGDGEHLFLRVRKTHRTTDEAARRLADWLAVPPGAVSYAGLKDRRAVTEQWFSIATPRTPATGPLPADPAVEVLAVTRNQRKLRRGALCGNRFTLTLREVRADAAALHRRLLAVARGGVPNYFGAQRFGRDGGNLAAARALLLDGKRVRGRQRRGLLLSAARSHLFNRVLAERVRRGDWARALPGELVMLDGSNSLFPAAREEPATLRRRLALLDVHPTGPLPGHGGTAPEGQVLALECQALAEEAELVAALAKFGVQAMRRALRLRVAGLRWRWPAEGVLELGFTLGAGAFATVVVREILALRMPDEA